MRTDVTNTALTRTLSAERLKRYLDAAGSLDGALALYERNLRLAEAFHTPLHCLEITLRNVVDECLRDRWGDGWLHDPAIPLEDDAWNAIAKAESTLPRSDHSDGAVIAELNLGFWVGLLGPRYDATLWRLSLHRGFRPNGRGLKRSLVHGRMNALRRFRNRVAHHEPIFDRDLAAMHGEILEAISWMCPHTASWTAFHSRFAVVDAAP